MHQRHQAMPLHAARVLKLVDEVMAVALADALMDERGGFIAHQLGHLDVYKRQSMACSMYR